MTAKGYLDIPKTLYIRIDAKLHQSKDVASN